MIRRSPLAALMLIILLVLSALPALAVQPDEMLADPALEAKAREISAELRCLVCQNQSIDDSDAPLAHDLRLIVRERLVAGDNKEQVLAYAADRFGDFVLLRPRLTPQTYLLWFAPLFLLLGGGYLGFRMLKSMRAAATQPPPLTEAEQVKLASILDKQEQPPQSVLP